jgi:hypothetical protein
MVGLMKIFDPYHIDPGWRPWWVHCRQAARISLLMAAASVLAMVHALVPAFLPEFINRFIARLQCDTSSSS